VAPGVTKLCIGKVLGKNGGSLEMFLNGMIWVVADEKAFAVGAVGATAAGDKWQIADFSNGRAQVAAPGVDVVSAAAGGGWASMSGTSMATPHVAGVAALWAEKLRYQGELNTPGTLRAAIVANATRQPLLNPQSEATGVGLVQCPQ
jgi:Subtilase family